MLSKINPPSQKVLHSHFIIRKLGKQKKKKKDVAAAEKTGFN